MTGLPTATVKLDDGSGTYPTDITSRVLMSEGVGVASRGRTDEQSQTQTSTLALALDNTDGLLTGGGLGFGSGGFGSGGPFGGSITVTPGMGIRFTETLGATTRDRFTGKIDALDLGWPGGGDTNAEIQLTAVDPLAELGRRRLRSLLEEEILLPVPTSYFTLSEAEGATSAGDTSGNEVPALQMLGTGAAVVFGNGKGPGTDGLTAAQFHGGQYLSTTNTGKILLPSTGYSIEVWINIATPPASPTGILQGQAVGGGFGSSLIVNTSGQVNNIGPNVCDGLTHQIVVTNPGSLTGTFYVDGVAIGTGGEINVDQDGLFLGIGTFASNLTGTMSHVATFATVLTPTQIANHYAIGIGTAESITARLARLVSYVGATSATTTGMSGQTIANQATSGRSAFDVLQEVAAAEAGVLYANGSGTIVLQGRGYRAMKLSADLTLSTASDQVGADTAVTYDTQQVINRFEITRTDGATQIVQDDASIAAMGEFSTSLDLPVSTDAEALAAAQWKVAKYKDPSVRLGSLTVDMQKSADAEAMLARDLGDRLALTNMPGQMWAGAGDVTIEGWSETLTHVGWTITANVLPWELFQAAIWDDSGSLWDSAIWAQ